ncbi:MAG: transposase [Chitinophagales bacterium]|nr:transposase [Chitinophagales bacterium]
MAFAYTIKNQSEIHFLTFTIHQWVDVFTREIYTNILLDSIRYCQKEKGLEVYAWVIMSNHCHFIWRAKNDNLSDIIRDMKKYTSKKIFEAIANNERESRKSWLLKVLSYQNKIWMWEEGYHGEEIYTLKFYNSKVNYIHLNPVRAGIVEREEDYLNSSAGDFWGVRKGKLELEWFG